MTGNESRALQQKAWRTIATCNTLDQLNNAMHYAHMARKKIVRECKNADHATIAHRQDRIIELTRDRIEDLFNEHLML